MSDDYALGSKAKGICDRCGVGWSLNKLRYEEVNRNLTHSRVCPDCWDPDHPQYWVDQVEVGDPYPLFDPRPDTGADASRGVFGWNPLTGLEATMSIGTVTVTTS